MNSFTHPVRWWTAAAVASFSLLSPALSQNVPLSAELRNQITALQAEKESRTPAQRKMDSQLVHLVRKQRGEKLGAGLEAFEKGVKASESGSELVDLNCIVSEPLLAALKAANGQIVASVPRFNSVRVRLPVTQLEAIAARDDVSFVKPAVRAMTHVGAVTTEGDIAHRSNTARSTLSATGRGVRIGVISDSVDSLTASQASGELGPVTVLPGQSGLGIGGSGEGTAMLEIVHDLAPDAELFFASAFLSEAQFAQNILDLRTAGCDIIVDDVGYFDESPLQDGPVAQAVNAIVADGGLYFSAAGNEGNKNDGTSGAWEGDFADAGPTGSSIPKAGRLHSFGANAYNILTEASGYATLFWADPAGASANDYDLYVLDASGQNVIGASTNIQSGRQDPFEIAQAFVTGSRLVVVKSATAAPRFLHLNTLRGTLEVSTSGTIQGHPAAAGAFAVAATPATSLVAPFVGGLSNPVETFSTDGNRRVFFQADGTAVTPGDFSSTGGSVRLKPDLTAADGVKTSVAGFNPFFGTSAAAPHAAAIAAQIWSRNRTLTSQQVREALIGSAIDIEEAGADRDSGAGIVNALAGTQLIPGGVIIVPGAVTIAAESYSPANGRIDPGETLTVNVPIQNIGSAPTEDLTVTLLSTGGIFNPGAAQSYGTLTSGSSDSRSFTFQGIGPIGTIAKATFQLSDGSAYLGSFSSNFTLGATGTPSTFTHAAATTIPTVGVANPYPSSIAVSGFTGSIGKITVRLTNFSHTFPADIDVLLVSPSGKKVVLMSNAGSGNSVSGITLTFDDGAASSLGSVLATGTFKPTALDDLSNSLPAPAPAGPYQNTLSAFTGGSPNGTWQLWVRDEAGGDSGSIGSWSLSIAPNTSLTGGAGPDITPALVQSQSNAVVGGAVSYTTTVYNNGAASASSVILTDILPAGLAFASATSTAGTVENVGGAVTAKIGTIPAGQNAVVTINATCIEAGTITNTVNVSLSGVENSTTNNSSSTTLLVGEPNLAPTRPPGWSGEVVISTVPETNSDATTITSSDPVYVDLAYINSGTVSAGAYVRTELYIDGELRRTFERQLPLRAGVAEQQVDISAGTFTPGPHVVTLQVDAFNAVQESNELDNSFTRTFFVDGPNLVSTAVAGSSSAIVLSRQSGSTTDAPVFQESDSIFLTCRFANNGQSVTGIASTANILLDGNAIGQIPVPATLDIGQSLGITDMVLGPLAAGTHIVRVELDSGAVLAETDESDNTFTKEFKVNAAPTISFIADLEVNEDQDTGLLLFTIDDAETDPGTLAVTARSSNPELVPQQAIGLNGTGQARSILLTPTANASGTTVVTITVQDESGGSATTSFTLTINSVNDLPTFVLSGAVDAAQDAGPQSIANFATKITSGPNNEASESVLFTVLADDPSLFSAQPAISSDGMLTFTPNLTASGETLVTVTATDSGGAVSLPQTFRLAVTSFAEELGFYHGLATPLGSTPSAAQAGAMRVAIVRGGRISGKISLGASSYAFKGFVLNDGKVRFGTVPSTASLSLKRKGLPELRLTLSLGVSGDASKLTGFLLDGDTNFAAISADKAAYDKKTNPAPSKIVGDYTVLFPAKTTAQQGRPASEFPQGAGFGRLSVDAGGFVKLKASLADGSKIASSATLSNDNGWSLFAYTDRKKGSLSGKASFADVPGMSDAAAADLLWFKPSGTKIYPSGWETGLFVDLLGSHFTSSRVSSALPGLTAADANGNASLTLAGGMLARNIVKALGISEKNKVTVVSPAADKLSLKLSGKTGLITGSFIHPSTGKATKLRGAVLQKQQLGAGFFLEEEAGSLTLIPQSDPSSP